MLILCQVSNLGHLDPLVLLLLHCVVGNLNLFQIRILAQSNTLKLAVGYHVSSISMLFVSCLGEMGRKLED